MSQPYTDHTLKDRTHDTHTLGDDAAAAEAIRRHHAELAATLRDHVTALVDAAEVGSSRQTWQRRDQLTAWLHDELLPHAAAEESALYPAAATQPGGRLLVDGMVAEHRTITELAAEVEAARTPVHVATAARALAAVFEVHLAKENDLILPLLEAAPDVSLADTVAGLHAVLGRAESSATRCATPA
jgi:Hemerythrin HHE cation binding domain.